MDSLIQDSFDDPLSVEEVCQTTASETSPPSSSPYYTMIPYYR